MKSRFRVLALRLAPLNYWMAPPLDFALNEGGVGPFFCVGVCALLVGLSLGRIVAAIAGTAVSQVRLLLYGIGLTATVFTSL